MTSMLNNDTLAAGERGAAGESIHLRVSIFAPDSIAALVDAADCRDRQGCALIALKIGSLSLRAARSPAGDSVIRHLSTDC